MKKFQAAIDTISIRSNGQTNNIYRLLKARISTKNQKAFSSIMKNNSKQDWFVKSLENHFSQSKKPLPKRIGVPEDKIHFYSQPNEFFDQLKVWKIKVNTIYIDPVESKKKKEGVERAKRRIVISSLYLGIGKEMEELV